MKFNQQEPARSHLPTVRTAGAGTEVEAILVAHIEPDAFQPRKRTADEQNRQLADSMAADGLLQPIIVRPHPRTPGSHQLIAGERRWRAAQLLQWETIAAIRREVTDSQMLILAYVKNGQRESLTPAEE